MSRSGLPKTHKSRVRHLQRVREALGLRIAGFTFSEIAAQLGINPNTAYTLVEKGMVEYRKEIISNADELRALELARLDAMQSLQWPAVQKGDAYATALCLKISERRSRLLGLDAVEKEIGAPAGAADSASLAPPVILLRLADGSAAPLHGEGEPLPPTERPALPSPLPPRAPPAQANDSQPETNGPRIIPGHSTRVQ